MTVEEFNAAAGSDARAALLRCCGSTRWAEALMGRRPFHDRDALVSTSESIWWTLEPGDWLEAFSAHPRIGQKKLSEWCSQEQNGVGSASAQILEQFADSNEEYERRFGWIFLINATGKSAPEMLDALHARLTNAPAEELRVAAAEQAKITELRLNKLLDV